MDKVRGRFVARPSRGQFVWQELRCPCCGWWRMKLCGIRQKTYRNIFAEHAHRRRGEPDAARFHCGADCMLYDIKRCSGYRHRFFVPALIDLDIALAGKVGADIPELEGLSVPEPRQCPGRKQSRFDLGERRGFG